VLGMLISIKSSSHPCDGYRAVHGAHTLASSSCNVSLVRASRIRSRMMLGPCQHSPSWRSKSSELGRDPVPGRPPDASHVVHIDHSKSIWALINLSVPTCIRARSSINSGASHMSRREPVWTL